MTSTVPGRTGERPRRRPPRSSARRKPPLRRRYLVRRWTVLGSLLSVLTVLYIVFFTSAFGARSVDVIGAKDLTPDEVRAAAAIEPGSPLLVLDTEEIADRVRQLPRVGSVEVRRSFPATIEIEVTERTPVAVVIGPDGAHLLDGGGTDYSVHKAAPPGLPILEAANEQSARAATTVLAALPSPLSGQIAAVSAQSPGNIRLTLTDGRLIKWGNPEHSQRKAAVLGPLLTRPGKTYDVTAPDFPAVS